MTLGDLAKDCEVLARDRIVAVACRPDHAPEVQIVLGQLGAKVVQVPAGEGRAGKRVAEAKSNILRLEAKIARTRPASKRGRGQRSRLGVCS